MSQGESLARRKRLIGSIGGYSGLLMRYRAMRPRWLWRMTSPLGKPTTRLVQEQGMKVLRGPFQGLEFVDRSLGHSNFLGAKLLGTYEPEVLAFLGERASSSDVFVDVGSGDGFFCVGMARLGVDRVIGFETNPAERELAEETAVRNRVRIEQRGFADAAALADLPDGRLLLLSDIEGFEADLIDPAVSSRFLQATMIVEIHEHVRPGVGALLEERFRETHVIDRFRMESEPTGIPELEGWDEREAALAAHDGHTRGDGWMTFVPR